MVLKYGKERISFGKFLKKVLFLLPNKKQQGVNLQHIHMTSKSLHYYYYIGCCIITGLFIFVIETQGAIKPPRR